MPPRGRGREGRDPGTAAGTAARAVTLAALGRVMDRRVALETALAEAPGFDALETRDRAFARLLAATCLRRAGEIEAVTSRLLERPLPAAAQVPRHILALGLAQLLFLGTPPHAAVATAVSLADARRARPYKGLINAVLRRAAREGAALRAELDGPRANTPGWMWESWRAAYGEAAARAIAEAHLAEPPLDITPRDEDDGAALAALLDAEALPNGTLRRRGGAGGAIPELPGYAEGRWWVQDAAAALPARMLGAVRDRRVLDLCAAPGGKTLQLAARGARVTAVDAAPARLALVAKNLARTGLAAELVTADARAFEAAPFDAVLLDAPCSATGTLRRHPDIARTRTPGDIARATALQDELLANAARLVRPGGALVYAVCALERAEGEDRAAAFLAAHPDFTVEPVDAAAIGAPPEAATAEGALRILPCLWAERGGMDGFFAVRLRRRA